MEFTKEEQEHYQQRLKERAERQAREAKQAGKETATKPVQFKSKIGRGVAGALTRAADKAEDLRHKADYIGGQANRIKKAINPNTGKPRPQTRGHIPPQLKPYAYKPKRSRGKQQHSPRVEYRSQARDTLNDLVHGPPSSRAPSTSEFLNDMTTGSNRGGGRSTSEFINDMAFGKRKSGRGRDPFKDMLG